MPLRQAQTRQEWVEEFTGGPNRCQVKYGGTCIRADIFSDNKGRCDGCPYFEWCLCTAKRLHGQPRPPRPKPEPQGAVAVVRDEPEDASLSIEDALRAAGRQLMWYVDCEHS